MVGLHFTFMGIHLIHFVRVGEPAQGSEEQQNDEHLRPALDNKVFDVSSIVENAVSHILPKFPSLSLTYA